MDEDFRIVEVKPGNVMTVLIKKTGNPQAIAQTIPDYAAPGSCCYTADLSYMANKDLDGTWKQIGG